MLKAEQVQNAHVEILRTLETVNGAVQALLMLVPSAPGKDGKPGPRMLTPDLVDSAQAIARALKTCKLDALVIAQTLMAATEEAREAAVAASGAEGAPPPEPEAGAEGGRVLQGDFTPKG